MQQPLEICVVLLINNKFDELKIAVNLFNLIDNKYALLYLGKLYYKYGYTIISSYTIMLKIILLYGGISNEES